MWIWIWTVLLLGIAIADITSLIDLSKKRWLIPYLFLVPHLPLLIYYVMTRHEGHTASLIFFLAAAVFFQLYTTIRLHLFRLRKNESKNTRIGILYGGRSLIHAGLTGLYLLPIWYGICFFLLSGNPYHLIHNPYELGLRGSSYALFMTAEVIYAVIFVWLYLANGCLRVFFTSRNLGISKRLLILLFMWVPFVQLYLAHLLCKAAKDEYLVAAARLQTELAVSVQDDACATRYPFVMVHGIGFRDLRFFNYWGRMPGILKQHGAKIYYGHQKAWGTIEENAACIAATVDRALQECQCEKVNLIAHSKGGLDCRYLISSMGYKDRVASLTTINTPHRGSELITLLNRLPDSLYRLIAGCLNHPFRLLGDDTPDCYASSKQLDPLFCAEFNEKNTDAPSVYYQSYASVMSSCFSDSLLSIPYLLMCFCGAKDNDGLVQVDSARWGTFRGILKNKYRRGISHGDMIDLKREDIRGFDVLQIFYDIAVELKKKGL